MPDPEALARIDIDHMLAAACCAMANIVPIVAVASANALKKATQ